MLSGNTRLTNLLFWRTFLCPLCRSRVQFEELIPPLAQIRDEFSQALTQRVRQIGNHVLILGGTAFFNGCR